MTKLWYQDIDGIFLKLLNSFAVTTVPIPNSARSRADNFQAILNSVAKDGWTNFEGHHIAPANFENNFHAAHQFRLQTYTSCSRLSHLSFEE